ncbi:MAG: monovalent cation/H+ antiporter subunit D [Porticoccaceae bacterium]|nr:monovalent cation/H+ antiporter subunit D [Porticoccaceae bacterium]
MSLAWTQHLVLVPVLLPLLCGSLLILLNESRHQLKFYINSASVLALLATALGLMWQIDANPEPGSMSVYLAANWSAPFGIALVADRLAALMLLLTAVMAACALLYSMLGWSRIGVHFHSLFQYLLMGLNGAFLTHDLFNLFVFFEVMLAASYGLVLHGYNLNRIRAGMQFIAINLVASLLFLIGVALLYAATGTLNMADLAGRAMDLAGPELNLLQLGAAVLAMAFLIKSAMWPLGFWLPTTYSAASPPVAVMFVLMTKVGVYAILRLWLLVFSSDAGEAAGFGFTALMWGGIATIVFGAAGMLASEVQGKLAGYGAIISSGTLLTAIGYGQSALIAPALFYLLSSTLAVAAFMLLIELIDRSRNPVQALLSVTMEAFGIEESPEQPVGKSIPAGFAFLGVAFALSGLIIAGLPPLSGFIAKFSLFHAVLNPGGNTELSLAGVVLIAVIVASGLAATLALMQFGARTFWASGSTTVRLRISEVIPIAALLSLCILMTTHASPLFAYIERVSDDLHQPGRYIERVLGQPVVPGVLGEEYP